MGSRRRRCGRFVFANVIDRRRIDIADPKLPGSRQPYHAAETLALEEAEHFLLRRNESSASLARKAIGDCLDEAGRKGYKVFASGIVLASGRPLPAVAAILASHALIHTAEGEFFRNLIIDASKHHGLQVIGVKEKQLFDRCDAELHMSQDRLEQHLASIGRALGPPWRQDEKLATLVAWLALATAGRTSN